MFDTVENGSRSASGNHWQAFILPILTCLMVPPALGAGCQWPASAVASAGTRLDEAAQLVWNDPVNGSLTSRKLGPSGVSATQWTTKIRSTPGTVASTPLFVGRPASAIPASSPQAPSYSAFAAKHRDRNRVIYSFDAAGMLNAYDAASGDEILTLATRSQGEQPATSTGYLAMSDAVISNSWHTMLIAATGSGLFAFDVTESPSSAQTGKSALWVFDDDANAELATRSLTQPFIVRLQDGTWAAIVAGNPSSASHSQQDSPALYVLDLASGQIIRRFEIPGAIDRGVSNAFGAPAAVSGRDGSVSYLYAGDRQGNLWKFDLTAPVPTDWKPAREGRPFFRARGDDGNPQAIWSRPEAVEGPNGVGIMVIFTAGSTLYAVIDRHDTPQSAAGLQRQTVVARSEAGSARMVNVDAAESDRGWYLELPRQPHERFVTPPVVRSSRLIINAQESPDHDCEPATTWTFVLDPLSGAVSKESQPAVFDSHDTRDASALESSAIDPAAIKAVGTRTGHTADSAVPTILQGWTGSGECRLYIYPPGSVVGAPPVIARCHAPRPGRQSWRQLR